MSNNIFYSPVDPNLREELDARAAAGVFNKSTKDLQFMLEKIANVGIYAYEGNSSNTNIVSQLGGTSVRFGRYMPNGPDGYLQDRKYEKSKIVFDDDGRVADLKKETFQDESKRVGPFITTATINIGDHSMGLLNKASIALTIPNPTRDLDEIETMYFRPGRFIRIVIEHPDSAVITRDSATAGLLTKNTIPSDKKLKEFYPTMLEDERVEFSTDLRKLNRVTFEGLITSFDFSFTETGTVDATLSLTGTSNVYTDVSMYLSPEQSKQSKKDKTKTKKKSNTNPGAENIDPTYDTEKQKEILDNIPSGSSYQNLRGSELISASRASGASDEQIKQLEELDAAAAIASGSSQFYDALYTEIAQQQFTSETAQENVDGLNNMSKMINLSTDPDNISDQFLLYGYSTPNQFGLELINFTAADEWSRYITLGYLIQFINTRVLSKLRTTVPNARILCNDARCFSNYFEQTISTNPEEILFLAESLGGNTMNEYGDNIYYNVDSMINADIWPGVYGKIEETDQNANKKLSDENVMFPSRILINLETIRNIILGEDGKGGISKGGSRGFNVNIFLTMISAKISEASGRSISMNLVTDPSTATETLIYADSKYVKSKAPEDSEKVEPYHVPLFATNGKGSLTRGFNLSATIPESVKNLSYTLNQGDDVSEEDIAPFVNFMYREKDPDSINKAYKKYADLHKKNLDNLKLARSEYGKFEGEPEKQQALYKALVQYIKYPTDDIRVSNLLATPMFPFTADFSIDGINGFRYGDVLQFDALPERYKTNAVFSIINVTHNVTVDGEWTTNVKCIMRPNIE